jgi:UDP-GlcNAc:undecaprenyl-phosphate GlcNAc-1-phosphate transferase
MASPLLAAFGLAAVATCFATPAVMRLAIAAGAVDRPGGRRVHDKPVPTWGGLAIVFGFLLSVGVCRLLFPDLFSRLSRGEATVLLAGIALICLLGGVDDRLQVRAKVKLAWQILAAALLVWGGVAIYGVSNPFRSGETVAVPWLLAAPLTVLWVVAVTNAINLIDGLDGLAAGVSAIACGTLSLIAAGRGQAEVALLAAALSGAAAGFLPWNFNPARVFMGDLGAYFLGYVIAAITVMGAFKMAASIAIFVPLLVLAVPLLDTGLSALRRYRRGQPIFRADRYHLHHQLLALGLSQRQIVSLIYSITLICCAIAFWVTRRS